MLEKSTLTISSVVASSHTMVPAAPTSMTPDPSGAHAASCRTVSPAVPRLSREPSAYSRTDPRAPTAMILPCGEAVTACMMSPFVDPMSWTFSPTICHTSQITLESSILPPDIQTDPSRLYTTSSRVWDEVDQLPSPTERANLLSGS